MPNLWPNACNTAWLRRRRASTYVVVAVLVARPTQKTVVQKVDAPVILGSCHRANVTTHQDRPARD